MTTDQYLYNILARETVATGDSSPAMAVANRVYPVIQEWGGSYIAGVQASGSYAKGTANLSGTDIDLFISISPAVMDPLKEIYEKLFRRMNEKGFNPTRQNVSINVKVNNFSVDLVPGQQQPSGGGDHSLWRNRANTWTKTNINKHIQHVIAGRRQAETRILKLWRNQKNLDFPSFYLELVTIEALKNTNSGLAGNVWAVFDYLQNGFVGARYTDPANGNNIVSDDLTGKAKEEIKAAAARARSASNWNEIVT